MKRRLQRLKAHLNSVNQLKSFPKWISPKGSVAVDRFGNRLGKGGGYGDMEIKHLLYEKSISHDTPIVTTVHELQIIESVPIEVHDQKINMIVTPKEITRIN